MNCFHCAYLIKTTGDYYIFDENYNFEIYRFCSLNCGLKHIMSEAQEHRFVDSKPNLVKKLKNFFDFYSIDPKSQSIKQALPFERLKVFGGDLSYSEYRKDFVCPFIDTSYDYTDTIYQDYIEYKVDLIEPLDESYTFRQNEYD